MINESTKWLYDNFTANGYNVGKDVAEFDSLMANNEESRKWAYETAGKLGYNVGKDYNEFSSLVAPSVKSKTAQPVNTEDVMAVNRTMAPVQPKDTVWDTYKNVGVVKPVAQPEEKEVLTEFGEGFKQGADAIYQGNKYFAGEQARFWNGAQQDAKRALEYLDAQGEGFDAKGWDVRKAMDDAAQKQWEKDYEDYLKVKEERRKERKEGDMGMWERILHKVADPSMPEPLEAKRINPTNMSYQRPLLTLKDALKEADGDIVKAREILEKKASEEQWADKTMREASEAMAEHKPVEGAAWWGQMVPQVTGQAVAIGANFIPGVGGVLGKTLSYGTTAGLTASSAGQAMAEARRAGASDDEVWSAGVAQAVIEAGSEQIPLDRLLGKIGSNAFKKGYKAIAGNIPEKELEKLLVEGNKKLGGKLLSGKNAKEFIKDMGVEGASEFVAEFLGTLVPVIYEDKENYPTLLEAVKNGWEGFKGGLAMGGFLGGGSMALTNRMQENRRKGQGGVVLARDKDGNVVEVIGEKDGLVTVLTQDGATEEYNHEDLNNVGSFTYDEWKNATVDIEQRKNESARAEGYEAQDADKNSVKNSYDYYRKRLEGVEGVDIEALDNDPVGTLMTLKETLEDGDLKLANEYVNAKAKYEGLMDRVQDDMQARLDEIDKTIAQRRSKVDGNIHPATMKDGDKKVYIINGNVATREDGTIDEQNSDKSVIVYDDETGTIEFSAPNMILSVDDVIDGETELERARAEMAEAFASEQENIIDGVLSFAQNDLYRVFLDGKALNVTVLGDNGDGTVSVDIAGTQAVMPKEEIQNGYNAYNTAVNDGNTLQYVDDNGTHYIQVVKDNNNGTSLVMHNGVEKTISTDFVNGLKGEVVAKENTPEQTEDLVEKTAIPIERYGKKTRAAYHMVPVERTIEDLMANELTTEEMMLFAQANINEAANAIKKLDNAKPQMGTDIQEYKEQKEKWAAAHNEWQKRIDYYNALLKALQSAQTESAQVAETVSVENTQPVSEVQPTIDQTAVELSGNSEQLEMSVTDNQGNPVDENGRLIVEEVATIDDITDADFDAPARNVQLPALPENVATAIGTNGKPVVIKKNVFEKNGNTHVELEPADSREILKSALYNPNIVGATLPIKRPDYKVAIRTGEKNAVVVIDVFQGKDHVEIVGWRQVNEKGLAKMQRQAEREGGQFLILSPNDGSAAALSALPFGLSSESEDRNYVSNVQENTQKSDETAQNSGKKKVNDKIPETADEFVASVMPKITPESFKRETGLKNSEQRMLVGYIAGADKGGVTVEQAAESIMEKYGDELRGFGFNGDVQDMRNMIIDILSNGNPKGYIKRTRALREAEMSENERQMADVWAEGMGFDSYEEYLDYTEGLLQEIEEIRKVFDETEYYNNLAEKYEHDTERERENSGRGGELLQEEQSVATPPSEITGEGYEGATVPGDVRGGGNNALAQGQTSQVNDVNTENVAEGVKAPGQNTVLTTEQKISQTVLEKAKEKLRARAQEWMQKVGVPVRVIESLDEVTNKDARKVLEAGKNITGWIDNNEVVIYLPNIKNAGEIDATYIHEVVAHKGLKFLMGENFDALCDAVWNSMSEEARAKFINYPGVNGDTRKAADEYMAHLAEGVNLSEADMSVWQKFVELVKEFITKNLGAKLTDKQIEALIKASYANLKKANADMQSDGVGEGFQPRAVFHGSGAQFDRFDHSFMGTGEGAQAYGWGTYVTEVEGIGKQYATAMRDKAISDKHKENAIVNNLARQVLASNNGDRNASLDELRNLLNESWSDKKRVKAQIKIIETGRFLPESKVKANLYTVEIPDDNGSNYLYWKADNNQETIGKLNEAYRNMLLERGVPAEDISPYFEPFNKGLSGESIYKIFARELGGDKAASQFLNDMGFVGISYPANATTGGRKDGARNYVIFNENDAQIQSHTMFRIEEVNEKFNEQLGNLTEENADAVELSLGTPSPILKAAGVKDMPMKLYGNKVIKKMKKHGFKLEELKNLPIAVADPIAVFNNRDEDGNRAILTELKTADGNFLVTIDLGNGTDVDFNIVSSVFGKSDNKIVNWFNKGFATYINKEKALDYLHLSAPIAEASDKPELSSAANIINNFENPSIESENSAADVNPEDSESGVRFRKANENQEIFVSNARRAVEEIKQEKATPEQWLAMIKKNGGLKAGEDAWMGLSEWLESNKSKSLTKQELLGFINENAIKIEEVRYSQFGYGMMDEAAKKLEAETKAIGWDAMQEKYPGIEEFFEYDNGEILWSESMASEGEYEDFILENKIVDANPTDNAINEKRESYTTEGLERKREIALVVPTVEPYNQSDEIHFGDAGEGRAVAWVRFGETTDSEGNRVLVIDEIQSKRHQDGRERGYKDTSNLTAERQENGIWHIFNNGEFVAPVAKWNANTEQEAIEYYAKDLVPSAPFEKNWQELAMKRMLRLAAEEGYDKVAWTTGEQQAERYNLGAVIKGLKAYKTYANEYYVIPYNNGAIGEFVKEYTEQELADTFGKELAQKIITNAENATEDNPYEIEGVDLRFGGEGMKGFYDRMLPSFVSKYTKKWGAKVGEVEMPSLEQNNVMHSVDVTPQMKESVMEGQTMFRVSQEALDVVNDFNTKNRGVAKVIFADGEQDLRELLAAWDFTQVDIEDAIDTYRKGAMAQYVSNYDKVIIYKHDVPKKELNSYLWHENTHRAIENLFSQEEMDKLLHDLVGENEPVVRAKLEELGYETEEQAEEYIARRIGELYLQKPEMVERKALKATDGSGEGAERAVSKLKDIIDYIQNGDKEESTGGRVDNRLGQDDGGIQQEADGGRPVGMRYSVSPSEETQKAATGETGVTGLTNRDVVMESDVYSKALGKPRYTGKKQSEYVARVRENMVKRAKEMVEKLHLGDVVEIVTDTTLLKGKKKIAKGFYDTATGKITVVVPNNASVGDIMQTILHEAVAHYGLRKLFGKNFDTFLDNVFNNADETVRRRIVELATEKGWDFRIATEEYLAMLAENTEFETAQKTSWWQKIKDLFFGMLREVGLDSFGGTTLTDNELRYILWRSYKNIENPGMYKNVFATAEDVAMQNALKVGNYAENTNINAVTAENSGDTTLFRERDVKRHEKVLAKEKYEERMKNGWYQSQEALQDSMLSLKEAMDIISGEKKYIEEYAAYENAYLGENRLSSVNKAEADLMAKTLFKPMLARVAELAPTEEQRQELTDYMMAKHGLERNEYMRQQAVENGEKNTDRDFAGLTALTGKNGVAEAEAEAVRMVEEYEKAHDTKKLWESVNAVNEATLNKQYECGLIDKATYDKINGMYQYYIPLRGFDEQTSAEEYAYLGNKEGGFNAPIRKAEGRNSKADDPFANMQAMAESSIMSGNRNKLVKQRFLNFVMDHPSDLVSVSELWLKHDEVNNTWEPVFPEDIKENDSPEDVERKMIEFEKRMEELAKKDPKRYKKGKDAVGIPYKTVTTSDLRQHQVIVKRDGRDFVLTVNGSPRLAQALNGLTNPDNDISGHIGAILKAGEYVNRQLSAFYTTRNPDFVVSNFLRDLLYANAMTWIKENPGYAIRFHLNYIKMNPVKMKELYAKYREGKLDMKKPEEKRFHQFVVNGGETGYTNIRDIEKHKNEIRKELERANGNISVKRAFDLFSERLDEMNRAVENCARFAAFMTSMDMGRSLERSIYDAKEISVNFNKKGSGAKFYKANGQTGLGNISAFGSGLGRSFYVFWNAAIQGTTNFGRQAKRHPRKALAAIATMFIVGALTAYMGGSDEEDDKNAYYNLPEYIRRSNILFRAGDSWISIPLPVEFRAVYGMGELMMSVMNGKERLTAPEIAMEIAGQLSQILPIDMLEGEGGFNNLVPSYVKPIWDAYVREKGWTGMPLYKKNAWNEDMPEWTKAYSGANKYIVGLAEALNDATGGDKYTKGWVDMNPAKLEAMLNGYFGGVAGTIDKMIKTAETMFGDREYDPRNILLWNRLVKAGDESTEHRAVNNEYYRRAKEAENVKRRLDNYERDTDNGVFDFAKEIDFIYNSPEYQRYLIYEDYKRDIKDLYKEMKEYEGDKGMQKLVEKDINEMKKLMLEDMESTFE